MIDKELKSKIADIIMEAIEEYNSNELNRPMIASVYAGEIISFINSLPEEPVSEDLEKAAINYMKSQNPPIWGLYDGFIAGAKYKEGQFEKNRLEHCNSITNEQAELEQKFLDEHLDKNNRMPTFLDAIEYGMRLQKEQMMTKAIEGVAMPDDCEVWCNLDSFNLEEGDKVKVIVIKKD